MKKVNQISIYFLSMLLWVGLLQAEGFGLGTLIATQYGLVPVESVVVGTSICNEHFVIQITDSTVNFYVKIFVKDCCIKAALNQKFYGVNKGWINAGALLPSDRLLCFNGTTVQVDAVEKVDREQKMYAFSVETNHIFYVTSRGIITHNFELVSGGAIACLSIACPPAAIGLAVAEAITAGIFCFGAYSLYKKEQKKKKQKRECVEIDKVVSSAGGNGKDPKDEEDDPKKHPYGIYRDASYHTNNCDGIKGPRPKNGQAALDNSVSLGRNSTGRVGISEGEIVILRKTSERLYHGYVETWDKLSIKGSAAQAIRNALTENKLVSQSGKIISMIITGKG